MSHVQRTFALVVLGLMTFALVAEPAGAQGFYNPPPDPDATPEAAERNGEFNGGTVSPQFEQSAPPAQSGYDPRAGIPDTYQAETYSPQPTPSFSEQGDFGNPSPPADTIQPSFSAVPPEPTPPISANSWQSDYPSLAEAVQPQVAPASVQETGPKVDNGVFQPGEVVAMVGDQPILAGEVMGQINRIMAAQSGQLPDDPTGTYNRDLMKQFLPNVINTKLLYLDFLRRLPPENVPRVRASIREQFYEKELPEMMLAEKVTTAAELDAQLRNYGSDLNTVADAWLEQAIAASIVREAIDYDPEITLPEMYADYEARKDEYSIAARVKWEQLMVRFDRFPNRAAAWQAMAKMGNQVLGGAPLDAVAKRESQGPTSSSGGAYDWTSAGSLKSTVLDEAIFSLPKGKLSRILEDEQGFHIVRVIERQPATAVPFRDAQKEIRETLREVKIRLARKEYLAKLREKTRITTVFDEDDKEMKQAEETRGSEFVLPR